MGFISLKKLSEQTKIDFYQLEKYIKYMGFDVTEENKIKSVNLDYVDTIKTFLKKYSTNEISYMISHNIPYNCEGTLLLTLRKKYNLNEKQFKSKCANADLEFKYVYDDEECRKFDDFMNGTSNMNRAGLRDLKYIKEGWIPLRDVIKEFDEKYDFCKNTLISMFDELSIEIYKPLYQLAFINKQQKKQFEDFLKQFNSSNERKLYFQEQTCMEKYGVKNPSQSNSAREKISEKLKESCTEERQIKIENTKLKKYGKRSITNSKKAIETRIKNGKLNNKVNYKYQYLEFSSSWEIYYYIYQKEILHNNIQKGKLFKYIYNGNTHIYECDFEVNGENVEIKGNQLLDSNGNLKQMKTREWDMCKQKCMEENNVIIISKEEIKPIIKVVQNTFGKDYINQFRLK